MRFFNTEGPNRAEDHYSLPPLERWDLDGVQCTSGAAMASPQPPHHRGARLSGEPLRQTGQPPPGDRIGAFESSRRAERDAARERNESHRWRGFT